MHSNWIALAAAFALLAGGAQPGGAAAAETRSTPLPAATTAQGKGPGVKPRATAKKKLVNLNAASQQELKGLVGGSDEEAARIIAGRPYNSKAFLLSKQIISAARYGEIKHQIVAGEPTKPATTRK